MADMSVGEVAGRLGVTPSTVRMWGSRYGLTASVRSAGGHRRYTAADVDRLVRMQAAVLAGTDPAAAAADVLVGDEPLVGDKLSAGNELLAGDEPPAAEEPVTGEEPVRPPARRGGPGGAVLAVPGSGPEVRGLARAASRLDERGVTDAVLVALRKRGTLDTWNALLRPVLVAAGEHWQRTGAGIEVEHLLTQAVTTAFAHYVASLPELAQQLPVVLAGSPHEDHVLALHAVRAGLAERGVPVRFLGPRTPTIALAATARLTRAPAVLIWMTVRDAAATAGLASVRAAHRRLLLLVGGQGWTGLETGPATVCRSLDEAITQLASAWEAAGAA